MFAGLKVLVASICLALYGSSMAEDVDEFMSALAIPAGAAPTNLYAWIPPADIRVQGIPLRVRNLVGEGDYVFNLVMTGGVLAANCCVGCTASHTAAVRGLCETLVYCVDMAMVDYATCFHPGRNTAGDVLIGERFERNGLAEDLARSHRTSGNLYLSIRVYTNAVPLTARAVSDALLSLRTPMQTATTAP